MRPAGESYSEASRIELLAFFMAGNDFMPIIESQDRLRHRDRWRDMLSHIELGAFHPDTAAKLHVRWHECHHFLRELIDDDALLLHAARAWLPAYAGANRTLYRGENIDRFEAGRLGSAWTAKMTVAEMFAGGLNAFGKGGVVLRAEAPAAGIISGPSRHSFYLGEDEFTVDPGMLGWIEVLSRFPAGH